MPRKKTQEEFEKEILQLSNNRIKVVGKYINSKSCCEFECDNGHQFSITPGAIFSNIKKKNKKYYECPECILEECNKNKTKTQEEFEKEIANKYPNNDYKLISNYINNKTDVIMQHKCGNKFAVNPKNFLFKNNGCPECSKNKQKNTKIFKEEVRNLVGEEYLVLSEYKTNETKILMKHNVNTCNHVFLVQPNNFLFRETRCPQCARIVKESKSVRKIKKILEDYNLEYIQEYEFKELEYYSEKARRNFNYPFDFKVKLNDEYFLIEFDGHQHEKGWNGNKNDLEKNKNNDRIKNEFCQKQNIPLLRISYKEESRLKERINNFLFEKFNDYYVLLIKERGNE